MCLSISICEAGELVLATLDKVGTVLPLWTTKASSLVEIFGLPIYKEHMIFYSSQKIGFLIKKMMLHLKDN